MKSGIYQIKNSITGKCYVGSAAWQIGRKKSQEIKDKISLTARFRKNVSDVCAAA